jgi:hypothetical protein
MRVARSAAANGGSTAVLDRSVLSSLRDACIKALNMVNQNLFCKLTR